jgi:peptide/nickel transport system ATP-binding protein
VNALTLQRFGVEIVPPPGARAPFRVLTDINFALAPGSSVGLVGRSGAGKSTLGNALIGLLPPALRVTKGSTAWLGGENLLTLKGEALRAVRGRRIAMVFQEPLLALDPSMRIGAQLVGALRAHGRIGRKEARERAVAMLAKVGIGDPRRAADRYAHELSGGMRQRLLLALALLLEPEVLIADEPTTALDATLQAQLLDLLDALREGSRTALLLISHDLGVVGERCDRVLALEGGRIVDDGTPAELLRTRRGARPWPSAPAPAPAGRPSPLLVLDNVAVHFHAPRGLRARASGVVRAVDGVSLTVGAGECLGLVGESGCGKTTLARAALGLQPLTAGRVRFGGVDLTTIRGAPRRRLRRRAQLVPQDAGASLTPHLSVEELVREGIEVHAIAERTDAPRRVRTLLSEVGLDASFGPRLARDLSSGERQRVAIARALACDPELLVCDEPVANVDAEMRDQLLTLLDTLRVRHGLTLLLISHDLAAVRQLASRVAVMYLGRIVERSESPAALDDPWMPYSQALRSALPTGDPAARLGRIILHGEVPSPLQPPSGCAFHPRCPHPARDTSCQVAVPPLIELAPGRFVACPKVAAPPKA